MKIGVVYNPGAGMSFKLGSNSILDLIGFFDSKDLPVTIKTTTGKENGTLAATELIQNKHTHILVCGGDGTINEVMNAVAGHDITVGIIPMGTENVLSKSLGIPLGTVDACHHFLNSEEKLIDAGIANDRFFLTMSGIGLDARQIQEMNPEIKSALGSLGFLVKGAFSLIFTKDDYKAEMSIKFNDRNETYSCNAWLILVGNTPNYSGALRLAFNARPDDGLLDIIVFPTDPEMSIQQQLVTSFLDNDEFKKMVRYFTSGDFEITTTPPVYCQIDGEILGKTPIHYRISPKAIRFRA